jgi:glycosyltransferase involved in cell wall biosynthesis
VEKEQSETQPPRLQKPVRITEQVWPEGTVPMVSVFNWAYNHVEFIRESIESILTQETTFPVEIIVHDDASTDGTTEIIREYEAKYPQLFRNIIQQENQWSKGKNVMAAMFKAPRGKYVALTHGDDYWTDYLKLHKQVAALDKNVQASGAFHAASIVDEMGEILEIRPVQPVPKCLTFADVVIRNHLLTCSLVYRSSAIQVNSDWSAGLAMGDWPLQVDLARRGDLIGIDEDMGCYRRHRAGVWTKMPKSEELKAIGHFYSAVCKAFNGCLPKQFYRRYADHYWECFEVSLNEQGLLRACRYWFFYLWNRLKYLFNPPQLPS